MADAVKTPVKKAVSGSSANSAATALATFNTNMAAAVTAALLAEGPPAPAKAGTPTSITLDCVCMTYDGTNWTYTSGINYISYVPVS